MVQFPFCVCLGEVALWLIHRKDCRRDAIPTGDIRRLLAFILFFHQVLLTTIMLSRPATMLSYGTELSDEKKMQISL